MVILVKAIIPTPKKKGGIGVDYEVVPIGASIWVTVSNEKSPLHGRHILITKRPDGLFALTGGAGLSADIAARRHMIMTGSPRKSKRDRDLDEEIDAVESHNAPLITARKVLESDKRKEMKAAWDSMISALGIEKVDKNSLLDIRDQIEGYVRTKVDNDEDAVNITDDIIRYGILQAEKKIAQRSALHRQTVIAKIGKQLEHLQEQLDTGAITQEEHMELIETVLENTNNDLEAPVPFNINLPDVPILSNLSDEERQNVIGAYFDEQSANYFEEDRDDHVLDKDEKMPQLQLGQNVRPISIESEKGLENTISLVKDYWKKKKDAEELRIQLKKVPLRAASPSTIADLRDIIEAVDVDITWDELEEKTQQNYDNWIRNNTAIAFYDAVGRFWNDDISLSDRLHDKDTTDSVMSFHVNSGAATALNALAREHINSGFDSMRLINAGNLELAAAVLALETYQKYNKSSHAYNKVVDQVREFNVRNQGETENRALERHTQLSDIYNEIQRQKQSGELIDRIRVSSMELNNLIEQRRNLGAALGSLQASATYYDYLERFRSGKIDDLVTINVGRYDSDAYNLLDQLRIHRNTSSNQVYSIDESDPENIKINVGLSSLGRLYSTDTAVNKQHDKFEELKTDTSGVTEDENGNLIVNHYDVPFWKNTFRDSVGIEHEYKWRVEQRNDVSWLLESTKRSNDNPLGRGGGLITRVVGSGKTNSAMAFFAHKIKEDRNYRGLVFVPKGRAEQWAEEAERYTELSIRLIPEGISKNKVDDLILSTPPGTVVIIGHKEAARSHDILNELQTNQELNRQFNGLVVDEPQELLSRGGSGNIGSAGRKIMNLPINHRIGLTATPAQKSPLEAYDMIAWVSGRDKSLGSKASFRRKFSGFSSGTNAQDTAIRKSFFDTIRPWVSGDRITTPTFKTDYVSTRVTRTPQQIKRQQIIEAESLSNIAEQRNRILQDIERNPDHEWRVGRENWRNYASRRATEIARRNIEDLHHKNIDNEHWSENAKLVSLRDNLYKNRDRKHVIFIDSAHQRQSVSDLLRNLGYSPNQIKNIAATTTAITGTEMAKRAREFQTNPKVNIIMIDERSSSGFNLQQGDVLHVVGSPSSAATYLQSQGRIARMPRKGDVTINTYQYDDDISNTTHWDSINSQLKVLRAAAPGMFPP